MRNLIPFAAIVLAGCSSPAAPPPAPAVLVAAEPVVPLDPTNRVENPQYARWAKFPVGTVALIEEVTDASGANTTSTSTYRLTEKTESGVVVEVSGAIVAPDGTKTENPPLPLRHVRWMRKPTGDADLGQPNGIYATGTETITVRGKEYKTRWYKAKGHVEAGETDTQIWHSDDVPGGVVKSVHRIPGAKKTVTAELIDGK